MSFEMDKLGQQEKNGGYPSKYGATQQLMADQDVFDSPTDPMDALRHRDGESNESCAEKCKTGLKLLADLTLGACFSGCCRDNNKHTELSNTGDDSDVRAVKAKLRYHFMNPFERWCSSTRRQFPWTLVVQLTSIIVVTVQLALFASTKYHVTDFLQNNKRTFVELFVLNPAPPTFANPIPTPIQLIYTNEGLLAQLRYTAAQYFAIGDVAVAPYEYQWDLGDGNHTAAPHLHLKIRRHKNSNIQPSHKNYVLSSDLVTEYYVIYNGSDPILDALKDWNKLQQDLPEVVGIHMDFTVTSAYEPDPKAAPECFQFNISFDISNDHRTGFMLMDMSVETKMSGCNNDSSKVILNVDSGVLSDIRSTVFDGLAILISVISILMCLQSLLYSFYLAKIVHSFFIRRYQRRLKAKHYVPLFDVWFVWMIASNVLVVVGSIMHVFISYTNLDSQHLVDATSIVLGVAVFGQWCGILRFLSYFDKYNMLLITLRLSLPSVLRFMVCAGILFVSFLLCGWLVLGPYHPKFRDTTVTADCLYALINGDDIFATYAEMPDMPKAVWIFSKIYLYLFIALFTFIVLSVFISLISDTYETLNDQWGYRSRGLLKDFVTNQLGRGRARMESHHSYHDYNDQDTDYTFLRDVAGTENVTAATRPSASAPPTTEPGQKGQGS